MAGDENPLGVAAEARNIGAYPQHRQPALGCHVRQPHRRNVGEIECNVKTAMLDEAGHGCRRIILAQSAPRAAMDKHHHRQATRTSGRKDIQGLGLALAITLGARRILRTRGDAVRAVALDDFARIGGPVALIVGFVQIILAVIEEDGIRSSNGLERRKQGAGQCQREMATIHAIPCDGDSEELMRVDGLNRAFPESPRGTPHCHHRPAGTAPCSDASAVPRDAPPPAASSWPSRRPAGGTARSPVPR